ncbi:MAG TPA: M13 family metallopeptidase, partial [Myxococcales bacterium]|nr:M13 family metallopeptidase [Myxococcales bacterium]
GQFSVLLYRNLGILHDMLDQAVQGKVPEGTPYADKLKDYYGTCMDEPALEKSLPALKAELKQLEAIKDPATLSAAITRLQTRGWAWPFAFGPKQDAVDATQMIAEVDQAGLGLPDREYYLSTAPKMEEMRKQYVSHLEAVFALLGDKAGPARAKAVMELETALAQASQPIVDRRDPHKVYHRVEREGLRKLVPSFAWDPFFAAVGLKDVTAVNATHPPFLEGLEKLFHATPPETWRAYLTAAVVRESAQALPKAFRDEDFAFTSKLTGAKADLPRWRRCVELTDRALGEALAVPFVNKTFGPDGKAQTQAMVRAIEAEFEINLGSLAWMDEPTKTRARDKLHQVANKIGYPDKWRSYDGLKTSRSGFLGNLLAGHAFNYAYLTSMIGRPVDRLRWLMTPPTVNAYYNPPLNEIVFPAGILQPPFYDRGATASVNYGGAGLVVGHELTHGFDDEGRQYDPKGNLSQWWTSASDTAFRERAGCVVRQYGSQVAVDDLKVNGELTLGENVADLGGLKLAFNAARTLRGTGGSGPEPKYRFTPDQQFFLGFAHSWCSKTRPEMIRTRTATDPHSPPEHRVNVPLRNFQPFAQAFGCREGDRMVLPAANRCEVW